ncbi:hypothetical protein Bbelb_347760 [Branchiostoma belcheri]|nr:hypothetical protein Bbelb_347760 [Branchiostoma belcheri]
MAGFPPNLFYLVQNNELLAADNRRQANSIRALVEQEQDLRQIVGECRRQLEQREGGKRELQEEVGRLRAQLLEKEHQLQELRGRREEEQPRRKEARRGTPGEFVPTEGINNTKTQWSALAPKTLKHKRAQLRNGSIIGLIFCNPEVTFRTEDGVNVAVDWPQGPFDRNGLPLPTDNVTGRGYRHQTAETKSLVQWCVYYKDQATVSDVWWHELQFPKVIPPLSWVQEERWSQNGFIPYQLEEEYAQNINLSGYRWKWGLQKDIITRFLLRPSNSHIIAGDNPTVSFRYGLDGRPQAKNTVIGAVMACITPVRNIEEAREHPAQCVTSSACFFTVACKEDYEEQVRAGSRVFREINDLQDNGLDLDLGPNEDGQERTKHVNINWYIVSDWKALAEMLGVVGPTGDYFCLLCYCTKDHISQFRQDYQLRSHDNATRFLADRRDTKGHRHPPLMNIPWENLIGWSIDQDSTAKLEKAMREIGISTFYIRKEATREGPNTFKWKTLKRAEEGYQASADKIPEVIKDVGGAGEARIDGFSGPQLRTILRNKGSHVPRLVSERMARLKSILGGAETKEADTPYKNNNNLCPSSCPESDN